MSLDALNHAAIPFLRRRAITGARFSIGLALLVTPLARWHVRAKQRHALLTLDDRLLADIGVTRAQAEAEAAKPFWQV